jgi:hypothetical protein
MKYGEKKDQAPKLVLHDTGIAEKAKFDEADNEFYDDFVSYDLDDQIIIAKELTYGLGNSQRGKDFLANLFEFQKQAIFDPLAFVNIRYISRKSNGNYVLKSGEEAIELAKPERISVFTKDLQSYASEYLVDNRRYKFEGEPTIQTDSIAEHLVQLIIQLYAGLIHFHATRTNDSIYMDNVVEGNVSQHAGSNDAESPNPDPDAVVSAFTEGVLASFVNDDQMRSIIDDIDWEDQPYDEPDWSKDYLDPAGQNEWTESESKAVAATAVASSGAFGDALDLPAGTFTAPVDIMFATMGAAAGASSLFDQGSASAEQQIKDLRSIAQGVTSLSALAPLPESIHPRYLETEGRRADRVPGIGGLEADLLRPHTQPVDRQLDLVAFNVLFPDVFAQVQRSLRETLQLPLGQQIPPVMVDLVGETQPVFRVGPEFLVVSGFEYRKHGGREESYLFFRTWMNAS